MSYADLADRVVSELRGEGPRLVGIGGAVAVGKSTVAAGLAETLAGRDLSAAVVATDAFLLGNAVLAERDLLYRKGFPESFDTRGLAAFLDAVRAGAAKVEIPVYSHETYDIVEGEVLVVTVGDVVILEGVVALQPPAVDRLDVAVYVDADERDVRGWFVERFLELTAKATDDPSSFYRRFADMEADQVSALAEGTWDAINGVNLREHIAPTRRRATIVVEKAADHSMRISR